MNLIQPRTLATASDAAIYTLYLYIAHKTDPPENQTLREIVDGLESAMNAQNWTAREQYRFRILKNAVDRRASLAFSRIGNLTRSKEGMNVCYFTNPVGDVFVVYRGTGTGEWIDNGEGLSGMPEENTYHTYGEDGTLESSVTLWNDYATDQQVEALNWFRRTAAQQGWGNQTKVVLAGHSKGGNKAQFVTIHSDLVDECYSFDGQGFSPEALNALQNELGVRFSARQRRIRSLSAANDYVNVLGKRMMQDTQIHYFESFLGFHYLEAMLDENGSLRPQSEQGRLSRYMETVSDKLMEMVPALRQYATLGVMNIIQNYFGENESVNGDRVSLEKTVAGVTVAVGALLDSLGV